MILIPVDEAAAFDALSILYVKTKHHLATKEDVARLRDYIVAQLGHDFTRTITTSPEYGHLLLANAEVFKMVTMAAHDECLASDVDRANQKRVAYKSDLQARFFGSKLTEKKSQRPKYAKPVQETTETAA